MKIVDRATFLALPPGTLYAKYKPCIFDEICIKGDNIGTDDFSYQDLISVDANDTGELFATLSAAEQCGKEFILDLNCESRDGCFDQDQLFAVWQIEDVRALVDRLQQAIREQAPN